MNQIQRHDGEMVKVLHRELPGKQAVIRRAVSSKYLTAPVGMQVDILGTHRGGFSIRSAPCAHCGVRVEMHGVHMQDLQLTEAAWTRILAEREKERARKAAAKAGADGTGRNRVRRPAREPEE